MAKLIQAVLLAVVSAVLSWLLPSGGGCKPDTTAVPTASSSAGQSLDLADLIPDQGPRWRLDCERYFIDVSKHWGASVRKDTGQPAVTIESIRCGGSAVPNAKAVTAFERELNKAIEKNWVALFKKNCSWEELLTPPIVRPSAELEESDASDGENTATEPGQRPLGALHIAVTDHLAWGEFLTVLMRVDVTCRGIFSGDDGESHHFSLNYNLDSGIEGKAIDELDDRLLGRLREACKNVTGSQSSDCLFFFGRNGVVILPKNGAPNPDSLTNATLIRYDSLRAWLEASPMRRFLELRSIP